MFKIYQSPCTNSLVNNFVDVLHLHIGGLYKTDQKHYLFTNYFIIKYAELNLLRSILIKFLS